MSLRPPGRRVRCPTCRKPPALLIELWSREVAFQVSESGEVEAEGDGTGEASRAVRAVCHGCGRRWTLRGVRCVADVRQITAPKVRHPWFG